MITHINITLSTEDLQKAINFYEDIGFVLKERNCNFVSYIITENTSLTIYKDGLFCKYTPKEITNSNKSNEAIFSIKVESKSEVDDLIKRALSVGWKPAMETEEWPSWLYFWSFQDPDGHLWEVLYSEPTE